MEKPGTKLGRPFRHGKNRTLAKRACHGAKKIAKAATSREKVRTVRWKIGYARENRAHNQGGLTGTEKNRSAVMTFFPTTKKILTDPRSREEIA
jgi:hypothetical protein